MEVTHELLRNDGPGEKRPTITTIVRVAHLDRDALEKSARYLISYVDQWVALAEERVFAFLPIEIAVGNSVRLSEDLFWRLVAENTETRGALNLSFVDALCARVGASRNLGGCLFYNTEEYCAGSFALFARLDYEFESSWSRLDRADLQVYDCFIRYLGCCDLDHEVHQDYYISNALTNLRVLSEQRYLDLLHLRLFNGQRAIDVQGYDYFRTHIGEEWLKTVLDYIVARNDAEFLERGARHYLEEYLRIVASVYGTDRARTQEIADYIRSKVKAPIEIPGDIMAGSKDVQFACDGHRAAVRATKGLLDSGFHKYDRHRKQWLPADVSTWQ